MNKGISFRILPKREKVALWGYSLMRISEKIVVCLLIAASGLLVLDSVTLASEHNLSNIEFFESRIRPILTQDGYECNHTQGPQKGGLALDHRAALLNGGKSGPAIIPDDAASSFLIKAIRRSSSDLEIPKSGAPLEVVIIHDFETWINNGAIEPRDQAPAPEEIQGDTNSKAILTGRKNWWSFHPIDKPPVPMNAFGSQLALHPVDAFINKTLLDQGLSPSEEADNETLLRGLSVTLLGVPPSPEELEQFLSDPSNNAFERKVDEYLASLQSGERWARHWMDWIRYAESRESKGDPTTPIAWYYRDYLIRALNQCVPYDQVLQEHLAGDLLPSPRIDQKLGLNKSFYLQLMLSTEETPCETS